MVSAKTIDPSVSRALGFFHSRYPDELNYELMIYWDRSRVFDYLETFDKQTYDSLLEMYESRGIDLFKTAEQIEDMPLTPLPGNEDLSLGDFIV